MNDTLSKIQKGTFRRHITPYLGNDPKPESFRRRVSSSTALNSVCLSLLADLPLVRSSLMSSEYDGHVGVRRSLDMGGRNRCQWGPARPDTEEDAGRHRRKGRGKRRNSYLRLEASAICAPAPITPVLRAPLPSQVSGRPPGGQTDAPQTLRCAPTGSPPGWVPTITLLGASLRSEERK